MHTHQYKHMYTNRAHTNIHKSLLYKDIYTPVPILTSPFTSHFITCLHSNMDGRTWSLSFNTHTTPHSPSTPHPILHQHRTPLSINTWQYYLLSFSAHTNNTPLQLRSTPIITLTPHHTHAHNHTQSHTYTQSLQFLLFAQYALLKVTMATAALE